MNAYMLSLDGCELLETSFQTICLRGTPTGDTLILKSLNLYYSVHLFYSLAIRIPGQIIHGQALTRSTQASISVKY